MTKGELKTLISRAFAKALGVSKSKASKLLPAVLTAGKAYEAYVLALVCDKLKRVEGCKLVLKNGTKIVLKTSHGPINRAYPWIEVRRSGSIIGDIFTDIDFLTLSYSKYAKYGAMPPSPGHYHELDIALVKANTNGKPKHSDILLAAECKNTDYNKGLLKEILGIRRELSLLADPLPTGFQTWPASAVPADPPSCLLVYSTSVSVQNYSAPGAMFGIDFYHEAM